MATTPAPKKPRRRISSHEREMEVMEHLAELRARLLRCLGVIAVASTIIWLYFDPLFLFFTRPIRPFLAGADGAIVVRHWLEPFFIHLKLAVYGGIVASSPVWIMELWGFISPALTPEERRPLRLIAPMTVVLFAMGVVLAHMVLPMAFSWALGYMPPGAQLLQNINDYVDFLAKMYLAFGLAFQMPVALMFLARVGIIDAPMMRRLWRQALVTIMLVAAIITPSNDPMTMLLCATPMALLYFLSIVLVEKMAD